MKTKINAKNLIIALLAILCSFCLIFGLKNFNVSAEYMDTNYDYQYFVKNSNSFVTTYSEVKDEVTTLATDVDYNTSGQVTITNYITLSNRFVTNLPQTAGYSIKVYYYTAYDALHCGNYNYPQKKFVGLNSAQTFLNLVTSNSQLGTVTDELNGLLNGTTTSYDASNTFKFTHTVLEENFGLKYYYLLVMNKQTHEIGTLYSRINYTYDYIYTASINDIMENVQNIATDKNTFDPIQINDNDTTSPHYHVTADNTSVFQDNQKNILDCTFLTFSQIEGTPFLLAEEKSYKLEFSEAINNTEAYYANLFGKTTLHCLLSDWVTYSIVTIENDGNTIYYFQPAYESLTYTLNASDGTKETFNVFIQPYYNQNFIDLGWTPKLTELNTEGHNYFENDTSVDVTKLYGYFLGYSYSETSSNPHYNDTTVEYDGSFVYFQQARSTTRLVWSGFKTAIGVAVVVGGVALAGAGILGAVGVLSVAGGPIGIAIAIGIGVGVTVYGAFYLSENSTETTYYYNNIAYMDCTTKTPAEKHTPAEPKEDTTLNLIFKFLIIAVGVGILLLCLYLGIKTGSLIGTIILLIVAVILIALYINYVAIPLWALL